MPVDRSIHGTLAMSLTRLVKMQHAWFGTELAQLGLHLGQPLVLAELYREEGLSQSQLAERMGVERPTVTKVLRGLETAGLVARERDPADTRVQRVRLTERGAALRPALERLFEEADEQIYGALDADERATLQRLLDRVAASRSR
jgi:DNA-binding MarR family transcriptional regulator